MINKTIQVTKNLQDRKIANIVGTACTFDSRIMLHTEDMHLNAKSLMGLFALKLEPGMHLIVEADGVDESMAVQSMCEVFE